jgi:hypothetical protein
VKGPRYDSDDDQAINIVAGADAVFYGWRMGDGGDGLSTVNITGGSLTVYGADGEDWAIRAGDSGDPGLIWNQSGGTVSAVGPGARFRCGDNGGVSCIYNISGTAVLNLDGEWKWGDDADIYMTMDGGEINIGLNPGVAGTSDWIFEARDGENHAAGDITCPHDDGPMTITVNGGLLKARNSITVGGGDDDGGTFVVDGGTVECNDLTVKDDGIIVLASGSLEVLSNNTFVMEGGVINIEGGSLILPGDQCALIADLEEAIMVGGYYVQAGACEGWRGEIICNYDGMSDKTTVTAVPGNVDKAWSPDPEDGAVNQSVDVVLCWCAGDSIGKKGHAVYFGTSYDDLNDPPPGIPPIPIFRGYLPPLSPQCYDPPETLYLWTTYYWRVDEINADLSITKGDIWSFTTGCDLPPDISGDCFVNFDDYAMMADDWRIEVFFPDDM